MLPVGTASTEVNAGERITVQVGETPDRSKVTGIQGTVDPRLVDAIDAAQGGMAGEAPASDAGRLAELRQIERAVIDGSRVLVRTGTGAFLITLEQLEAYATLQVETGAIRPEERAELVQRRMSESRAAFRELFRSEMEALEARLRR
jgi:hypothetical protein